MEVLPARNIERFCRYRKYLLDLQESGAKFVHSHELAKAIGASSAQVRRDMMMLSLSGTPQKGYSVVRLLDEIACLLDKEGGQKAALVGVGHLGNAILTYFASRRPNLWISAAFDIDPSLTGKEIADCVCFDISSMEEVIEAQGIGVGIICTPEKVAQEMTDKLVRAGVKGIVNFTPCRLDVPSDVFLENVDITVAIEKTAYFARNLSETSS
jgi:redox-sensing transcriptional repressor